MGLLWLTVSGGWNWMMLRGHPAQPQLFKDEKTDWLTYLLRKVKHPEPWSQTLTCVLYSQSSCHPRAQEGPGFL